MEREKIIHLSIGFLETNTIEVACRHKKARYATRIVHIVTCKNCIKTKDYQLLDEFLKSDAVKEEIERTKSMEAVRADDFDDGFDDVLADNTDPEEKRESLLRKIWNWMRTPK